MQPGLKASGLAMPPKARSSPCWTPPSKRLPRAVERVMTWRRTLLVITCCAWLVGIVSGFMELQTAAERYNGAILAQFPEEIRMYVEGGAAAAAAAAAATTTPALPP